MAISIKEAAMVLGCGLFCVGMARWSSHTTDQVLQQGKTTVCTVSGSGNNMIVGFAVDGAAQQIVIGRPYARLYEGETFALKYLDDDLKNAEVLFWEPVFDSKLFAPTPATSLEDSWTNPPVSFTYTVDGKNFERSQKLQPGKELDELKQVRVLYKKSDPRIAYLVYER
ncbi:hypothetical protein I2I05_20485 [Hymenobacter sp. BT683]|uniref:Uncharacterized protein n=1 Tax=Hymenobacter jeongseonensis TaxID=2791027 RepID=A0ABS0IPF0_9BACT|nr:hypothetical protein [Hymenobacter jeongseonensis]MBF9239783.1 hypothetical protein [Hymenobacter jeongseonensis]